MAARCPHGLPAEECLICPRVGNSTVAPRTAATVAGRTARRGGLHVAGVVGAIVVIGLVAWAVAGVVFALLHVLELIAVAFAAGWAGYHLGLYRGAHRRP